MRLRGHFNLKAKIMGLFGKCKKRFMICINKKGNKEGEEISEENKNKLLKNLGILGKGSKGALKKNVNEILQKELGGHQILVGKSLNIFDE